jgi:cysteine desulfurase/selenocysteine lyase
MINYKLNFPLLRQKYKGQALVYFDNAATHPKPDSVLRAIDRHYRKNNSNVHRGVNFLAQRTTESYEAARVKVAQFIGGVRSYCSGWSALCPSFA